MKWFYEKDGRPAGPVDDDEFARLVAAGTIAAKTLVWHSGFADWKAYDDLHHAVPAPARENLEDAAPIAPSSPDALPATDPAYAGFWIRVAASLFDALIFLPVLTLLNIGFMFAFPTYLASSAAGAQVHLLFEFAVLALFASYETVFIGRCGATPGKMICNLRVIRPDGGRVTYGRAFGRGLCEFCTLIFFGVGFLLVAITGQKCALHDLLCETRVVHTE
jgi:uncharacterized RDD family membrane protein YckC